VLADQKAANDDNAGVDDSEGPYLRQRVVGLLFSGGKVPFTGIQARVCDHLLQTVASQARRLLARRQVAKDADNTDAYTFQVGCVLGFLCDVFFFSFIC
jgi:hypothetical protein